VQPGAVLITAVAGFLLFRRKCPVQRTRGGSAALGLLPTLAPTHPINPTPPLTPQAAATHGPDRTASRLTD
jgi:hypothetical protein